MLLRILIMGYYNYDPYKIGSYNPQQKLQMNIKLSQQPRSTNIASGHGPLQKVVQPNRLPLPRWIVDLPWIL